MNIIKLAYIEITVIAFYEKLVEQLKGVGPTGCTFTGFR